jgi:hypothetical protein
MHCSVNPEEIKTGAHGHKYLQNLTSVFLVELKPVPNNGAIFNVEYIQQCKIKFKPPKHKRHIVQCADCQRYGHTNNYCHFKARCVKCTGDCMTSQYHRKEASNDVRCVLCIGNHPASYK